MKHVVLFAVGLAAIAVPALAQTSAKQLNAAELQRLQTGWPPPNSMPPPNYMPTPAQAQQWPTVASYPAHPAPSTPQSWSYDPYTSGSTACPQFNWGNIPPCREILLPTAGQPDYRPTR
jgi:hypothetical protein